MKNKIIDVLPDSFATEEEAGEFWDTHSVLDYLEFFEPVEDNRRGKVSMTPTEVLNEIQKLPLNEARQVANRLNGYLREKEQTELSGEELERREDEFEQYLLSKGIASHIATRDESDKEFDDFEMIEVEGEPLSETIIRERR